MSARVLWMALLPRPAKPVIEAAGRKLGLITQAQLGTRKVTLSKILTAEQSAALQRECETAAGLRESEEFTRLRAEWLRRLHRYQRRNGIRASQEQPSPEAGDGPEAHGPMEESHHGIR
jgi:hypothetical protein